MNFIYKRIVTPAIVACLALQADAQCWNNINTVTTQAGAVGSNNTWDWTQQQTTMYLRKFWNYSTNTCPPTTVTLPMWAQFPGVLNNKNLLVAQDQLNPLLKDHQPADGWELLFKEFGNPGTFDMTVENPVYGLYNRYSGKIRVFLCLATKPSDLDKKGVSLVMEFTDGTRRTGLLQHLEPIAQQVITFTPGNNLSVPNFYANEDMYWFCADFPVAYDPCTCHDPKESKINIELLGITQYDISEKINGTQVATPVVQNASGTPEPENSAKNSGLSKLIDQDIIDAGKKGYEYYQTWDGYRATADKVFDQMDKYVQGQVNAQLKDQYPNGITVNNTHYDPTIKDFKKTPEGTQKLLGEDYDPKELGVIKSITSIIPYVGAIWGVVDFFVSKSDKNKAAKAEQAPVVSNTNINLTVTGTSISTAAIADRAIHTPGSTTNTSYNAMPIYNNILGVVNVMNIPDMEYVEYKPRFSDGSGDPTQENGFIGQIRQYRFKNDVHYVLNPAAKMDVIAADAAIVLEFDGNVIFRKGVNPMMDVDQMPVEFGDYTDSATFKRDSVQMRMENVGWETEYLSDGYFNNFFNSSAPILGIYRIRTPYVPLQCISKSVINLFSHKDKEKPDLNTNLICCRNRAPKMMLKIVFTLKRKDKTTSDGIYTQVITYDLTSQKANATKVAGYDDRYYDVQKAGLIRYALGFTGGAPVWPTFQNTPTVVHLSNMTVSSDLYVHGEIYLDGNVTINDGVTLHAGKKIEVNPDLNTTLGATNNLMIGIAPCETTIESMQETDAAILAYCTGDSYHNRAVNTVRKVRDMVITGGELPDNKSKSAELYPNPVTTDFAVKCSGFNKEMPTSIAITDMLGKDLFNRVYMTLPDETATMNFNVSNLGLTPGIYFVAIQNGTFKQIFKVNFTGK